MDLDTMVRQAAREAARAVLRAEGVGVQGGMTVEALRASCEVLGGAVSALRKGQEGLEAAVDMLSAELKRMSEHFIALDVRIKKLEEHPRSDPYGGASRSGAGDGAVRHSA